VIADLDGPGTRYVPSQVATLVNPVGVTADTAIHDVAATTAAATHSNGATH